MTKIIKKNKKKHVKNIKIFLKKKNAKSEKRPKKDIKILLKKKKKRSAVIIMNVTKIFLMNFVF